MAPPEPPTEIKLKIKVPGYLSSTASETTATSHGNPEEFEVGLIPVSTTIGSIRHSIQQRFPTHPLPERQRLLYGGHALVDDDQSCAEALNIRRDPTQKEYVIHLVVKGEHGTSSRSSTPAGLRSGLDASGTGAHRRIASSPSTPAPPTDGTTTAPGATHQPQRYHHAPGAQHLPQPHHNFQHQQNLQHQMHQLRIQQQMLQQQLAQSQGQHGMMPGFMGAPPQLPFGMPHGLPVRPGQHAPNAGHPPSTQAPDQSNDQQSNQATGQQNQNPPSAFPQGEIHLEGVGPNGQHFHIHQQTVQIPYIGMRGGAHGPQLPFIPLQAPNGAQAGAVIPPMMPMPGMMPPQMAHPPNQQNGATPTQNQQSTRSALDQARENMAEMRRLLDEIRQQPGGTEELRQRAQGATERARLLNDYIDPFGAMYRTPDGARASARSTSPRPPTTGQTPVVPQGTPRYIPGPAEQQSMMRQLMQQNAIRQRQSQVPTSSTDVTAYLLSSPRGPEAILFSPQHGTFTGALPLQSHASLAGHVPTPTRTIPSVLSPQGNNQQAANANANADQAGGDPVEAAARAHIANGVRAQAAAQDPLGPFQPILGHFWLLLRILIFAYFLLGANMGWQRPILLLLIGFGFWMVRMGVLAEGGPVRRWWDGVVGVERRAEPQQAQQGQEGAGNAAQGEQRNAEGAPANEQANANGNRRPRMPTPEQVAQRIINEQNARDQQQQGQRGWLREQIRPVERALALFVASLWPGIGEAHVREQRRLAEEEQAARRRADEERVRHDEERRQKQKEQEKEKAKISTEAAGGSTSASGTSGSQTTPETKTESA